VRFHHFLPLAGAEAPGRLPVKQKYRTHCFSGKGRHPIRRPFPSSSPSAPRPVSQLPIPAETPRVSATPSLRGFAAETVPPTSPAQTRKVCPYCDPSAPLLPALPAFGLPLWAGRRRRIADEAPHRLPHPRGAPTSCHALCCHRSPKVWQPLLSLRGQLGRLRAGCLAKVLLAGARPRSFGADPGRRRKGARFPAPKPPSSLQNAGTEASDFHR